MLSIFYALLGWVLSKIRFPIGWLDRKIIDAAEWCFEKSRDDDDYTV